MSAVLVDLEEAVRKAGAELVDAQAGEDAARQATRALNAYNEAARKLDAHLRKLREEAPRGTDWSRSEIKVPQS